MLSQIPNLFGKQSLTLFSQIAETITTEYVEDITKGIIEKGYAPSFEELMHKVKALNNELSLKVVWLRDNYKIERGRKSARLTRGCKKIINRSVDDFLRTVKLVATTKSAAIGYPGTNTPSYKLPEFTMQ